MIRIIYSPRFVKLYRELQSHVQTVAETKEKIFRKNPRDTSLKTHKLHGKLKGCFAFWIDYRYRIIFTFDSERTVTFHAIGGHEIYE